MVLDEADAVDPEMKNEDFEEIRRSQVLMDIYGAKIKQIASWYFENPVVMVELANIGAIGKPAKVAIGKYDH